MSAPRFVALATTLAVVAACGESLTEPADSSPLFAHVGDSGHMVPFKGVLTQTSLGPEDVTPGPSFDPGCVNTIANAEEGQFWVAAQEVFGEVNATHVGQSTLVQNGCLEISGLFGGPGPVLALGEATITSANGDLLRYDYDGSVETTTFIADVDVVITGGTGRFANASGGFSTTSEGNALAFPVVYEFSGVISAPSARH